MPPKREASELEPELKVVKLSARGLTSDVRLRVFETEFHVHSTILKLHSAFFYKFLDSPDKEFPAVIPPGGFKYEWVTKVDDDGSWSLVCESTSNKHQSDLKDGDINNQTDRFSDLIRALYDLPYTLSTEVKFLEIVELADYYCALPKLSQLLSAALMRSSSVQDWHFNSGTMLEAAYKLRHPELFRECLIFLAGQWGIDNGGEVYHNLSPTLERAVNMARARIYVKIGRAHMETLDLRSEGAFSDEHIVRDLGDEDYLSLPLYYLKVFTKLVRYLHSDEGLLQYEDMGIGALSKLMRNNLRFSPFKGEAGCYGPSGKHFSFCGEISDEDLPWDRSQTDW